MIVVMGMKKLLRLDHKILMSLQFFRRDLQSAGLSAKTSRNT